MKVFAALIAFAGMILTTYVGYNLVKELMPTMLPAWTAGIILWWVGIIFNAMAKD